MGLGNPVVLGRYGYWRGGREIEFLADKDLVGPPPTRLLPPRTIAPRDMALSDSVRPLVRPETVQILLELATRERQGSNDHLDAVERKLIAVLTATSAYVAILAGLGFAADRRLLFGGVALGGLAALVSVGGLASAIPGSRAESDQ